MSEDSKDSGLLGIAGGAAAGAATGFGIYGVQKDRLIKGSLAEVDTTKPDVFAEGDRKSFREAMRKTEAAAKENLKGRLLDFAEVDGVTAELNSEGKTKAQVSEAWGKFRTEQLESTAKEQGIFKNMTMKQRGTIAAGFIAAAVVGKVAFDALFGQRKNEGFANKVEADRAATAGAETGRG